MCKCHPVNCMRQKRISHSSVPLTSVVINAASHSGDTEFVSPSIVQWQCLVILDCTTCLLFRPVYRLRLMTTATGDLAHWAGRTFVLSARYQLQQLHATHTLQYTVDRDFAIAIDVKLFLKFFIYFYHKNASSALYVYTQFWIFV